MKWITRIVPIIFLWVSTVSASYVPENDIDLHTQTVDSVTTNSINATLREGENPFFHFNANDIGALSLYRIVSAVYEGGNFDDCYSNSPIQIPFYQESLTPIGDVSIVTEELTRNTQYCLVSFLTYSYLDNEGIAQNTTTNYVDVFTTPEYARLNVGSINSGNEALSNAETFSIKVMQENSVKEAFLCSVENSYWFNYYRWPKYVAQCINNNSNLIEAGEISESGKVEPIASSHLNYFWAESADTSVDMERLSSHYSYKIGALGEQITDLGEPTLFSFTIVHGSNDPLTLECRVDDEYWYPHYRWTKFVAQCINDSTQLVKAGELTEAGTITPIASSYRNNIWASMPDLNVEIEVTPDSDNLEPSKQVFFDNDWPSDTTGTLLGTVLFAQNTVVPSTVHIENDLQPTIISQRKTLVMFMPKESEVTYSDIVLSVINRAGDVTYEIQMRRPEQLTMVFGQSSHQNPIDDVDNFEKTISSNTEIRALSGEHSEHLISILSTYDHTLVSTGDGRWAGSFYLPQGSEFHQKTITFKSDAGYNSTVYTSLSATAVVRGTTITFENIDGVWVSNADVEKNLLTYSERAFSASLPANVIEPNLTLKFYSNDHTGQLTNINVGSPNNLLLHTIDLGMLVEPRGSIAFQHDQELQRQYFHTIPVSKLIVSQYEPQHFTEVMLPDGQFLTDIAPGDGGVHSGIMRGHIAKILISHGINHANYGLNSTGTSESFHPYSAAQITAHTSRGRYENGVINHGLSGGNGMVTLLGTTGNEFSHELGHNFGLGHYPGGFSGAVHRMSNQINSTWGWDSDHDRFIPNFEPVNSGKDSCHNEDCQPPFFGRRFGKGAMSSGYPMYKQSQYTLHTPYELKKIQNFFQSKANFDPLSETGFSKWHSESKSMQPWSNTVADNPFKVEKSISSNSALQEIGSDIEGLIFSNHLVNHNIVNIITGNGHWTSRFYLPNTLNSEGKIITFRSSAAYGSRVYVGENAYSLNQGMTLAFIYQDDRWQETAYDEVHRSITLVPNKQGVKVATLVGYYDPEKTLTSYIYAALYGSYGAVYEDNFTRSRCQLNVELADGNSKTFNLHSSRLSSGHMNKFHVNVETALKPKQATIVCDNDVIASREVQPEKVAVFTHIIPLD